MTRLLREERFLVLLLIAVCLLLFFARLGDIPLYDNDEGIHAVTSKDMVLSGDWVTTTFNGEPFYDKPVLYNWFAAFSFLILGFTEFAARLPAALLGLGSVLVTYALGRRLGGPMLGFLGGMILATSPEFITLSRAVVHDISLVFFVTLTLCFFFYGFTASPERRKWYFLPFYAATGFAVLAKGPVGLVLPGAVVGLFLISRGRLSFVKYMSLGWGVPIFIAVVAPWYVLISLENPEYAGYFFIQQNLMNFLSSSQARHPEAFYYYLPVLMGGTMPWSVFLPLALVDPLRRRLSQIEDGPLFLLLWFGVVLLFFSSAVSKLGTYILPLFPAVALLVAFVIKRRMQEPTPRLQRVFLYSFIPVVAFFVVGFFYGLLFPPKILTVRYGINLAAGNYFLCLLALISLASLFALVKDKVQWFLAGNVALVVLGILVFLYVFVPSMDPYRTTKHIAERWDADLKPQQKLVFFKAIRDTALFYTDRRAIELWQMDELVEHLVGDDQAYVLVGKKYYNRLDLLRRISEVVHQEGNDLLLRGRGGKRPRDTGTDGP